jgi:hypothetical protein
MIQYFVEINTGRMVLWNYLLWYFSIVVQYFDPSPRLWLSSLGISVIIGIALVLSTSSSWSVVKRTDRWQLFRLFLMPFCVSSFAALIKDQGFVLVFSSRLPENVPGALLCGGFALCVLALKKSVRSARREIRAAD